MAGRCVEHAMHDDDPRGLGTEPDMDAERRAFYEFHASLLEPWDGPAAIAFTDGRLHRRDPRPQRAAPGALAGHRRRAGGHGLGGRRPAHRRGRILEGPARARARLLLVDTEDRRAPRRRRRQERARRRHPYRQWIAEDAVRLDALQRRRTSRPTPTPARCWRRHQRLRLHRGGAASSCSPRWRRRRGARGLDGQRHPAGGAQRASQLLFAYFKQLFAQVTNPPIDPIREELVMSLGDQPGRRAATCSSRGPPRPSGWRCPTRS